MSDFWEERPPFPTIRVPYTCSSCPYDNEGFFKFPQRSQWVIQYDQAAREQWQKLLLRKNDGTDRSYAEKVAFLQAWLFFGVLTDVMQLFGVSIRTEKLLVEHQGQLMVSTGALHEYGHAWASHEAQLNTRGREARNSKVLSIMHKIESFASQWEIEPNYYRRTSDVQKISSETGAEILFSIIVLSRFLGRMILKVYGPQNLGLKPASQLFPVEQGILSAVSHRRIAVKSFCPSDLEMIRQQLHGPAAYFASFFERPHTLYTHQECSKARCASDQIDDATYHTQHVRPGNCDCPMANVSGSHLASIIQRKGIPRISVSHQENEMCRISLRIDDCGPFVAISHVWSHGLGNLYLNALPICQLHRLSRHVIDLGTRINTTNVSRLWIDTLCIPVGTDFKDSRRLAVQNLDAVYDQAVAVLVVDAEMQHFSLRESLANIGLQIIHSTWCRRLWTLTEGSRAVKGGSSRLYFQFREGSISFDEIRAINPDNGRSEEDLYLSKGLWQVLNKRIPSFTNSASVARPIHRLYEMAAALSFRTTSRLSDEPLCIARLLELPSVSITSVKDPGKRMRNLFILIGDFPSRIIFHLSLTASAFADGSKLEISGYKWAPRSFLEDMPIISGALTEEGDRWATCTPEGLRGSWCGFIVENIIDLANTPFMANGRNDPIEYKISCLPRPESERNLWCESCQRKDLQPRAALLFHDIDPDHSLPVILGTIIKEEDDVIFFSCLARGQNRTRVDATSIVDDVIVNTEGPDRLGDDRATMRRVTGTFVPLSQKWCIV